MDKIAAIFDAGGWAMYPLLVLSIVSVAVTLERSVFWAGAHRRSHRQWLWRITSSIRRADRERLERDLRRGGRLYGRFARSVVDAGQIRSEPGLAETLVRERVEFDRPRIERFSTAMSTIITAAPMIGILGTVTGIIRSFRVLGDRQIEDPSAVAGGIAEALLTTAFGLIVALITLFPYMAFRAQAERCFARLELLGTALLALGERAEPAPRSEERESHRAAQPDSSSRKSL